MLHSPVPKEAVSAMRRLTFLFVPLSSLLFSLLFSLPAFGQAKHPFTFEDMMKLKRVGEPVPSPDGKWVLFAAVDVDLAANKKTSHIWIVPFAGGAERVLIADQDGDRPRWAPDGKRFAFISNKDGGSQIWVAGFDGTTGAVTGVHQLTRIATEADGELWSPDGKSILFTSNVYPECDNEVFVREYNCNLGKRDEVEKSKVKALVFDHLLYRHWNAYKEGKRSHILVMPAPDLEESWGPLKDPKRRHYSNWLFFHDLTPGDYDAPVFSLGGQDNYAFSPDGQEICYTSNHDKNPAASTNNDLWIVSVNGGAAKNITADNPASDSTPLYSPDGKYIAYRAQKRPGDESDRFTLMLYERVSGQRRSLMPNWFDKWVGSFTWARHLAEIYFTTEGEGMTTTWSVGPAESPGGKAPSPGPSAVPGNTGLPVLVRITQGYDDDLTFSQDGKILFFTRMSVQRPTEIQKLVLPPKVDGYDLPKGEQLTHFNDTILSQVSMSPLEPFWFVGTHDDKVEGFLVKPPNFDPSKKYPVKFLIHGGPEGAWGDDWSYRWNPELFAAPTSSTSSGYVVIMINFHGSTGYGQKFMDAINGDW